MSARRCTITIFACIAAFSWTAADARPPASVVDTLRREQVRDVATRASQLPKPLQSALAKTFRERHLYIADAGRPFQATDSAIVRLGERRLPSRRLLFAFRAGGFYVVYYESGGYGLSVNALVFSEHRSGYRFAWGGVERDYQRPARTPSELVRRISRNRLIYDASFQW